MDMIIAGRNTGKSVEALKWLERTGGYLVCRNPDYLVSLAQKHGLNIFRTHLITYETFLARNRYDVCRPGARIFIDDLHAFAACAVDMHHAELDGFTLNCEEDTPNLKIS